ncbi:MAG: glycosyltransferase family 2 protein [Ruminococcaceae bacterium]|nr:glycosyltransferase family 2 protein [Oscillospiraceae bacterium]
MKLSLVIPCYNEEENVKEFYRCVKGCFDGKIDTEDYEFVFVDDGSRDNTLSELRELSAAKAGNIKVISFSRNFGKESAIYAGMTRAAGDNVCIIDADLQQRPEVVLRMMEILESKPELDCVAAYQEKRKEGKGISLAKTLFYKLIDKMAEVEFVNGASDFRLMKRTMVNAVLNMTEYHRFSKGIFSWVGFNTEYIPYEVAEREHGESKWNTGKLIKYALDGIVAFTTAPLKIAIGIGFGFSFLSMLYLVVVVVQKLFFGIDVPGYATIIVLILLLGGLILFCLGIIGEYVAKMYVQVKNRPIFIEREYFESKDADD